MFDVAELKRKLSNLVRVATVASVKSADGKALATVAIDDEESEFFPVLSFSNSFRKHWVPVRNGEQVLVFCPFGNANKGYVLRSIFFNGQNEPSGSDNDTEILEYSDGTRIEVALTKGYIKVSTGLKFIVDASNFKVDGDGNVWIAGEITDNLGNLTKHEHSTTDGATAKPR